MPFVPPNQQHQSTEETFKICCKSYLQKQTYAVMAGHRENVAEKKMLSQLKRYLPEVGFHGNHDFLLYQAVPSSNIIA